MDNELEVLLYKVRELSIQEGIKYDIRGLLYEIEYKIRECIYAIKDTPDDGKPL